MKKLSLIATAAAIFCVTLTDQAGACKLHSPVFELTGFPISPHQVAVLGGANVVEQSPTPTLTVAGMPASPHQIAVLTPRSKAAKVVQASADRDFVTVGLAPTYPRSVNAAALAVCLPD